MNAMFAMLMALTLGLGVVAVLPDTTKPQMLSIPRVDLGLQDVHPIISGAAALTLMALGYWIFGIFSTCRFWSFAGYIVPAKGKNSREVLDYLDFLYIAINIAITALYGYHFHMFAASTDKISWAVDGATIWNTVVTCLLQLGVYDMVYCPFHRALHLPAIYPYIHKHHHRQLAPTRGTIDGINTHPIEFTCGIYLHIFALFIVPCHAYGAALFLLVTSLMASLNHTRWAVKIPGVFDVRDHDMHHQIFKCNYAQYVPWWDLLMGTHRTKPFGRDKTIT